MILLLAILLMLTTQAHAAMEITWEYSGEATHYTLYRDGEAVAQITGDSPQTLPITPQLGDIYTMTATGPDGETEPSWPYTITPAADTLGRLNNTIRLRINHPHGRLTGGAAAHLGDAP